MAYALSFAPEFFWGDGSIAPEDLPHSNHSTSVYQAILSLPDDQWAALGRDAFDCNPDDLDPETVLCKVQETNTCRNLDSTVEVFIDPEGFYTLLVHETSTEGPMNAPTTLGEYVAQVQHADVIPRPEGEDWSALIARIGAPGQIAAIDEEIFWYFLEVLPPKYQRGGLFAFAEGAEALRLFWRKGDRYFCRQLTWDETMDFCRLAHISLPS